MVLLRLSSDSGVRAIVHRPSHFGEPQVLALSDLGLHTLTGFSGSPETGSGDVAARVKLGPRLELWLARATDGVLSPFTHREDDEFWRATCDPSTGLVYIGTKATILEVNLSNPVIVLSRLAGMPGEEDSIDGPGPDARVDRPFCMLADGHGSLLIKDCGANRVRRVCLPPPGSPRGTWSPLVTTLPTEYAANIWAVALDYADPQRLYVATKTALYRHESMPYDTSDDTSGSDSGPGAAGPGVSGEQRRDPSIPTLLAGQEGENTRSDGLVCRPPSPPPSPRLQADGAGGGCGGGLPRSCAGGSAGAAGGCGWGRSGSGSGWAGGSGRAAELSSTARFGHITFMLLDSMGRLIVVEREPNDVEPVLRIVWPSGLITTFNANFEVTGSEFVMTILPHGWLALHAWDGGRVKLVRLDPGLRPSLPRLPSVANALANDNAGTEAARAPAAPGQLGLSGLAADLGSLLVDSGGGNNGGLADGAAVASDVTLVVGERRFRCHRAILGARCDYFRKLFQGGFADSAERELSLPDADPDAFSLLLRFLYTASMDIPPPLLRPTAELADRLLLPAAARHAQQALLAATCAATVVEDLLWAEQHQFEELLAGLKDFYLRNAHLVLEEVPDSLEVLMLRSPKLHLELYAAGIKRARRA